MLQRCHCSMVPVSPSLGLGVEQLKQHITCIAAVASTRGHRRAEQEEGRLPHPRPAHHNTISNCVQCVHFNVKHKRLRAHLDVSASDTLVKLCRAMRQTAGQQYLRWSM
eukprot:6482272-Amphidinium_carterae.1